GHQEDCEQRKQRACGHAPGAGIHCSRSCKAGFQNSWHARLLVYSGLMPAVRITAAHFSLSSATTFANSAGEPGRGSPPRAASRAFILRSASAALISLLSLSTISAGVPVGAKRPNHPLAS